MSGKINKPGIYQISNRLYHEGPGLSSSALKELLKSGAHYSAYTQIENEGSTEMRIGSLVHCMILEPEKVKDSFYVGEYIRRYGKEFDNAIERAGSKEVVSREEYDISQQIVESFIHESKDHPSFNGEEYKLLEGQKEMSFYWEDPKTGILCKCRPDNITNDGVIVDIKTTKDATAEAFQRSIMNYGYHLSAAFYLRGVRATLGACNPKPDIMPPKFFVLVVIETKPPFAFQTFYFSEAALLLGDSEVDRALETYSACVTADKWQGYSKKMVEIDLPAWAYYNANKRGTNNE